MAKAETMGHYWWNVWGQCLYPPICLRTISVLPAVIALDVVAALAAYFRCHFFPTSAASLQIWARKKPGRIFIYIYMWYMYFASLCFCLTLCIIPVVPHRAAAEVSKIGHYRRGDLLWCTDGRANPLMDVVGAVFFAVVAMVAVVTSPTTAGCSVA